MRMPRSPGLAVICLALSIASLAAPPGAAAAPTLTNNRATKFLVPHVLDLKESPTNTRTGWTTAFGIHNSSSQAQRYRFRFFSDTGASVVTFLSNPIPARNNVFETPETLAAYSNQAPSELMTDVRFTVESGSITSLLNRTFSGYVLVEHQFGTVAFNLSAWMARGGSDFLLTDGNGISSFGFDRAGWMLPAIPVELYQGKQTRRLIFPGITLEPASSGLFCPQPGMPGVPLGLTGSVSLVNLGPATANVTLSFLPSQSIFPVVSSQTISIAPGRRVGAVLSQHFADDLGAGVLLADVAISGGVRPTVLGYAAQSDAFFQYMGYSVTGQAEFEGGSGTTPSLITGLAKDFWMPYAVRVGVNDPPNGYDTQICLFPPSTAFDINVHVDLFHENGTAGPSAFFQLAGGEADCRRMDELGIGDGFVGQAHIATSGNVYAAARVVRGGYNGSLFGWQGFVADVPVVPTSTLATVGGLTLTAVNETAAEEQAPECPNPAMLVVDPHVNGFELGLRVVNLGSAPVTLRLEWQTRWQGLANPGCPGTQFTLLANASRGLVLGADIPTACNPTDGMAYLRVISAGGGKILAMGAESDKFFRWFSYSVSGQNQSSSGLP